VATVILRVPAALDDLDAVSAKKAAEMSQRTAYLVGFVSGLVTIAAFLLPVLILTGWEQSPASAIALVAGIFAAFVVNTWLVASVETDGDDVTTNVSGPFAGARR
jgi:hypothetical protein